MVVVLVLSFVNNGVKNNEPIKIGFIGSLTGVVPSYGEAMKGGVEIALKEINSKGGINGRPVEVIYEDGKCIDSKSAVSAAQKLINIDKVQAIIGGGCSNEVLSISKLVNDNKIFLLSSGASSPNVSQAGEYIYRNAPNDAETGYQLAKRFKADGYEEAGIISDQTEFSIGFRQAFIKEFENLGGKIVVDVVTSSPVQTDFRADLSKISVVQPEALFINPNYPSAAGLIAKQARDLGIKSKFYSYHATADLLKAGGSAVDGSTIITFPLMENDLAKAVLSKFVIETGYESTYPYFTVAAYDAMNIIANAIKTEGYSGEGIKKYVDNIGVYSGALGNYPFTKEGDITNLGNNFQKVIDGQFVNIK